MYPNPHILYLCQQYISLVKSELSKQETYGFSMYKYLSVILCNGIKQSTDERYRTIVMTSTVGTA